MDEATNTDVGGSTPAAVISQGMVADTPVSTESNGGSEVLNVSHETSSQATTGSSPDAAQTTLPSLDEVMGAIPENDDDLAQLRDVPEAIRNQRQQIRVLGSAIKELNPLSPYKDLVSKGTPEVITSRLETFDKFFTPAIDPYTQQPKRDERTGAPLYDTTPFWEQMNSQQPGSVEQATRDLLYFPLHDDQGNPVIDPKTGKQETMLRAVFRDLGLDPDRREEYQNIDKLIAGTGNITPEELESIPAEHREAFKQLPAKVRDALWDEDVDTRNWHLARETERLQTKQAEQRAAQAKEAESAKQQQVIAEYVEGEQGKYLSQQRQEGYQAIYDDLASKVTFSTDSAENNLMLGLSCLLPTALIDPELRFGTEKILNSLGIQLSTDFDQALNAATENSKNYKAWELAGLKVQADRAKSDAYGPTQLVRAKLASIAQAVAAKLGAQKATRAKENGNLLTQANQTRPVLSATSTTERTPSMLPPGVAPDSPEANALIWQGIRAGQRA